jgi:hypothetical protein
MLLRSSDKTETQKRYNKNKNNSCEYMACDEKGGSTRKRDAISQYMIPKNAIDSVDLVPSEATPPIGISGAIRSKAKNNAGPELYLLSFNIMLPRVTLRPGRICPHWVIRGAWVRCQELGG